MDHIIIQSLLRTVGIFAAVFVFAAAYVNIAFAFYYRGTVQKDLQNDMVRSLVVCITIAHGLTLLFADAYLRWLSIELSAGELFAAAALWTPIVFGAKQAVKPIALTVLAATFGHVAMAVTISGVILLALGLAYASVLVSVCGMLMMCSPCMEIFGLALTQKLMRS